MGFTSLEADIYVYLLQQPAVTGYRVAQSIGKPAANTYKAIESLERKGAILVDEGDNRLCRAVPAEELLNRLERQFLENRKKVSDALANLQNDSRDDRLYQLKSKDQVLERCRSMLGQCKHVAVMDAYPDIISELKSDIEQAGHRGVEVIVKTYESTKLNDVRVIVRPRGHEILDALPGHMISLNIDGAEHLLALVRSESDEVYQAIWTSSAIISYLLYNGLVNELSQVAIMSELESDTTVEKLRRVFTALRHLHPTTARGPAYQNLLRHMGITMKVDPVKLEPNAKRKT